MAIKECWTCRSRTQPCECITKYGESPDLRPVPSKKKLKNPGKWFNDHGIYPACGAYDRWDDGAYPPHTDSVKK
jgi:hypothetical protein